MRRPGGACSRGSALRHEVVRATRKLARKARRVLSISSVDPACDHQQDPDRIDADHEWAALLASSGILVFVGVLPVGIALRIIAPLSWVPFLAVLVIPRALGPVPAIILCAVVASEMLVPAISGAVAVPVVPALVEVALLLVRVGARGRMDLPPAGIGSGDAPPSLRFGADVEIIASIARAAIGSRAARRIVVGHGRKPQPYRPRGPWEHWVAQPACVKNNSSNRTRQFGCARMNGSMSSAAVVDQKVARGPIPRGARRRGEIARAAEHVFLQHGFAETTMQMVALEAGASKETLYRHFVSKEDLFIEVVNNRNNEVRQTLDLELESDRPVPIILKSVGFALLDCMCSPTIVALARIIVNEAPRNPGLGNAFYAMAPGRTLQKLTHYLTTAKARQEFTGDDPAQAADIFIGSVMGKFIPAMLFIPHAFVFDQKQIEDHVNEVVDIFTKYYTA